MASGAELHQRLLSGVLSRTRDPEKRVSKPDCEGTVAAQPLPRVRETSRSSTRLRRASSSRGSLYSLEAWDRDSRSPSQSRIADFKPFDPERDRGGYSQQGTGLYRTKDIGEFRTKSRSFPRICDPDNYEHSGETRPRKKKRREKTGKTKEGGSDRDDGERGEQSDTKLKKKKRRRPRCEIHSKSKRDSRAFNSDDENNPIEFTAETEHYSRAKTSGADPEENPGPVCTCRKKTKHKRPEPEGGYVSINLDLIHEYDRLIYSNEPIFSDLDDNYEVDEQIKQESDRHHKRHASSFTNMFNAAQLVHTNTMMKFAIIQTELRNIIETCLKRVIIQFYTFGGYRCSYVYWI